MKLNYILPAGIMALATAGLLSSCSETEINDNGLKDGETYLTVKVMAEGATATRAESGFTPTISQGSMIDVLVYAVYNEKGNLLSYFQTENGGKGSGCPTKFTPGTGQNAVGFQANETKDIVLKVHRDSTYQIACWAQSSECSAYNTADLKNVTVSYVGATNNDESRDAFAGVSKQFKGSATTVETIVLTRPFAQINVGTTGADFKMSAKIPGGCYYTYSRIDIKGVADHYNVMTGKAVKSANAPASVTFSLKEIPAYYNMEVPTAATDLVGSDMTDTDEEFLQVELDGKDGKSQYKTNYSTINRKGEYLTETFKYMSMCYVLVESEAATKADVTGSSLDEVTLSFSGDKEGKGTEGVNTSFTLTNVPAKMNYRTNILGGLTWINPKTGKEDDPKDPSVDPEDPTIPDIWPEDPDKPKPDPDDPNNPDPDDPDNPDPDDVPEDVVIDDPKTLFNSVNVNVIINQEYLGDKNFDDNTPVPNPIPTPEESE